MKNTYKLYKIELETGKISESYKKFEYASDAQNECDLLNESQVIGGNIKWVFYYRLYNDFAPFKTQEQLQKEAKLALDEFNKHINRLKALSLIATKSLLQGGLNKKEAV